MYLIRKRNFTHPSSGPSQMTSIGGTEDVPLIRTTMLTKVTGGEDDPVVYLVNHLPSLKMGDGNYDLSSISAIPQTDPFPEVTFFNSPFPVTPELLPRVNWPCDICGASEGKRVSDGWMCVTC